MKQPELSTRIMLAQLESNKSDYIAVPGSKRKIKICFLHDYTVQKITELLLEREEIESAAKDGDPNKIMRSAVTHPYFSIKIAALAVLNDPIKIALFYPIKWRWWAYVRKYNEAQIASVTMAIQKKNHVVLLDVLSNYLVLEGYKGGFDEDDEGGNRAIPSRTHAGVMATFVKDFPCYGDTRWVPFVGRIVNYTARCVLTIPQIRIMQADLPHTLFRRDTKRPALGGPSVKNDDAAFRKQEEANKKAAMRRARKGGQYTTDQLFEK